MNKILIFLISEMFLFNYMPTNAIAIPILDPSLEPIGSVAFKSGVGEPKERKI